MMKNNNLMSILIETSFAELRNTTIRQDAEIKALKEENKELRAKLNDFFEVLKGMDTKLDYLEKHTNNFDDDDEFLSEYKNGKIGDNK